MAQIAVFFYVSLLSAFGLALLVVNLRMLLRARKQTEQPPAWARFDPRRDHWGH